MLPCRVALTGSDEKLKKCLELGADAGINYKNEDFVERAKAETGGKGLWFQTNLTLETRLCRVASTSSISEAVTIEMLLNMQVY